MSSPMYPGRSIEELPYEVLLLILENVKTPSSVFSFIHASPIAFRIFQHNKITVLTNAIRRSIHPAVLPLAITVCDAARDTSLSVCSMAWERAEKESHDPCYAYFDSWLHHFYKYVYKRNGARGYKDHLKVKAAGTTYDINIRLQHLSLVLSLCRLWCATEFFIRDYLFESCREYYSNETRSKRPNSATSLPSIADFELSESEYGRLQRGIFHFELYRHLFSKLEQHKWLSLGRERTLPHTYVVSWFSVTDDDSRRLFSIAEIDRTSIYRSDDHILPHHCMFNSCLTEAEKGELFSIKRHLHDRMNVLLGSVYGHLISKLEKLPRRRYRLKTKIFIKEHDLEKKIMHQLYAVKIALLKLGLPFIQNFIKMKSEERLAVVELCASQLRKQKLYVLNSYDPIHWVITEWFEYRFVHQLQQRQQTQQIGLRSLIGHQPS